MLVEKETHHSPRQATSSPTNQNAQAKAWALYDYTVPPADEGNDKEAELSFSAGDSFHVLQRDNPDWWYVRDNQQNEGFIPTTYISFAKNGRPVAIAKLPEGERRGPGSVDNEEEFSSSGDESDEEPDDDEDDVDDNEADLRHDYLDSLPKEKASSVASLRRGRTRDRHGSAPEEYAGGSRRSLETSNNSISSARDGEKTYMRSDNTRHRDRRRASHDQRSRRASSRKPLTVASLDALDGFGPLPAGFRVSTLGRTITAGVGKLERTITPRLAYDALDFCDLTWDANNNLVRGL
ncbi:hypothetical protein HDU86_003621 [Geranomyces michiganensis]|nr:hypothetical protein HDU86_003621 [Geranomyces michiganensis]